MDNTNGAQISVKFKNSVTGQKKLEEYSKQLATIQSMLSGMDKENILALSSSLKNVSNETKKVTKQTKKAVKLFDFGFKTGSLALLGKTLTSLSKTMMKLVGLSASYVENVNLLEVAYANINRETGTFNESIESSSQRIEKYIDKMSEVYGLDESRLTRQFGIFKQLANAMELPAETGEHLSEIMVKMTNDVASLYNLPLERASNALQSALVGQVRPIRGATGADITEKTLQKTVDQLGLDKSISDLSFVEKRLIMVISLTNQLKVSQGDYARTIESAANQVKIMNEQWERLSRAVGNVFYPILENVLPYINAILMALTEIFNMLASLFNFKMPDFDYSTLAGVSDVALDLEDEMLGAGEATDQLANKLKGLRSFDKLNVINTPSDKSSGSGGGGGIGAVDPTIMNAFNKAFSEYDDKMNTVKMKALEIRDAIMEWLGFEKIINPLTGETEWKYKGIGATIKSIVKWFEELSPLAKTIVGYFTYLFGKKVLTGVINLVKALGNTGLFKALSSLLSPFANIIQYIRLYTSLSGNMIDGMKSGLTAWRNNMTTMDAFKIAIVGVAVGMYHLNDAMRDMDKNGISFKNLTESTVSIVTMTAAVANLGSKIQALGQYGGVIGALVSAFAILGNTIYTGLQQIERAEKYFAETLPQTFADTLEKSRKYAEDTANSGLVVLERDKELVDELENLIDSNGKVKKEYEERAEFILGKLNSSYGTEYQLIDGMITKNGELVTSYDEVKKAIQKVIEQKQLEILLRAYEDEYITALKVRKDVNKEIEKYQARINAKEDEYNEKIKQGYSSNSQGMRELQKSIDHLKIGVNNLKLVYDGANGEILKYEDLIKASTSNNFLDMQYALQQYGIETERQFNKMDLNFSETNKSMNKTLDLAYKGMFSSTVTFTDNVEGQFNKMTFTNPKDNIIKSFTGAFDIVSKDTNTFTTNEEKKFNTMDFSKVETKVKSPFENAFDKINTNITPFMNSLKTDIETKAGQINPQINFQGNTTGITNDLNAWVYRNRDVLGTGPFASQAFNLIKYFSYAGGGLPPVGQVFVANERGPELVDQIGGQTFVANKKQIGEYMDKKYGSYQQPVNVTIPVSVGGEHLGTIVLNNLQELAKTNGQPITIG